MINHAFEPEPFGRDACDRKFDDGGRAGYCGRPKAEHLAAPAEETGKVCHETMSGHRCDEEGPHEQHRAENAGEWGADLVWTTPTVFPKKWPRRVGWKKLQERRKACRHVVGKGRVVESITFAADRCPRCLGDELAYWKARSRSAEGNAARETVRALRLEAAIAVERSRVGTLEKANEMIEEERKTEKARAVAAIAEVVNEQRRFGEMQAEAWKLEAALAVEKARAVAAEARIKELEALVGRCEQALLVPDPCKERELLADLALDRNRPKLAPAAALVVCEYCPDHPHPLNDDGTECKFPKPAPAQAEELPL